MPNLVKRISAVRETRKHPHYEWMHPSWRDLVIDHLSENAVARKAFLGRCGIDGIMLALSSGGGAKGKRETPLLITTDDWDTLLKSTNALLRTEGSDHVFALLEGIADAMPREDEEILREDKQEDVPLYKLAREALDTCRDRWNQEAPVIPMETLEVYCRLSEVLDPLPPMPSLKETWGNLWKVARDEITFIEEHDSELETHNLMRWLKLVSIIANSEPRFLVHISFPESYVSTIVAFLDLIENKIDFQFEPQAEDEYSAEVDAIKEFQQPVRKISTLFPSLQDKANGIESELSSRRTHLEQEMIDLFPEEDSSGYDDHGPSGGASIDEIFEDL